MGKNYLIRNNKDPDQVNYKLKTEGVQLFEKMMSILGTCSGLYRLAIARNVDPEDQLGLLAAYIIAISFTTIGQVFPTRTVAQLNAKVFLYEKLIFVLFCKVSYQKLSHLQSYQQDDQLPSYIAMQTCLIACYIMPFKHHMINLASTWFTYIIILVMQWGIGSAWPTIFRILFTAFAQLISKRMSMSMEQNLNEFSKSLEAGQNIMKKVFNYLPEGVLICKLKDKGHRLQFWNSSFEEIIKQGSPQKLGVTVEAIEKINVKTTTFKNEEANIEDNLFEQGTHQKIKSDIKNLLQVIVEMTDLQIISLKITQTKQHLLAFKMKMPKSSKTLIFLRDVTVIRDNQKQTIHKQLQSVFLSSITHDLKSPIHQILSTTQYLQLRNLSKQDLRVYKLQEVSCNFMLSLIDDIIDLGKFQLNKFELNPSFFNVQELINEIQEMFELKMQEKGIKYFQVISEQVPDIISLDRKRIKQVIMNLLSNAVKFTTKGYITLEIKITKTVQIEQQQLNEESSLFEEEKKEGDFRDTKSYLTVSVTDTGVGISPQGQTKLFKLFGMLNKTKQINPNGTGLGLVICKRISEAMKGSMKVNSVVNQGSTFTATFQLENDQIQDGALDSLRDNSGSLLFTSLSKDVALLPPCSSNAKFLKTSDQQNDPCSHCKPYLVIDDDSFNILAIELLIEEFYKRRVDSALSAAEGIKQMKEKLLKCCGTPYEVVFVDLNMPELNGDQMMEKVSQMIRESEAGMEKYSQTKFVLCTAQSPANFEEMKRKGFQFYIEKPLRFDELSKVLGNNFRKKKSLAQTQS